MCVHFLRFYVYFVKISTISTSCIQLLKYAQVQMLLSDLITIFYCSDLENQLCLGILPPPPPVLGLVYIQIQDYFHLSLKQALDM